MGEEQNCTPNYNEKITLNGQGPNTCAFLSEDII